MTASPQPSQASILHLESLISQNHFPCRHFQETSASKTLIFAFISNTWLSSMEFSKGRRLRDALTRDGQTHD